jgi:hypothetical protein
MATPVQLCLPGCGSHIPHSLCLISGCGTQHTEAGVQVQAAKVILTSPELRKKYELGSLDEAALSEHGIQVRSGGHLRLGRINGAAASNQSPQPPDAWSCQASQQAQRKQSSAKLL